jgi:hypothetical protein
LYEQRPQDRIFAEMRVPNEALRQFAARHAPGYSPRPDPEERAALWEVLLAGRRKVNDDTIPVAYLSELDQGVYGAIVGGRIQYMVHPENGWISSMVAPILDGWHGFEDLRVDRAGDAYRYFLRLLACMRSRAQGKFGVSHFILIDGLNFLFELFGASRTYLEVADHPEKVREAIDFAYRLNVGVQSTFFDAIPLLEGGTCSNMAGWIPGRIVSESVDPFHMTSADYFERWGREPVERILRTFDGGVLHIHGNGRHLLPSVATVKGLKALSLLNDRGFPSAFSVLSEMKKCTGDLPLVVEAEFAEFSEALERRRLPGGVLYKVKSVPDCETASCWMEKVRAYRV